MRKNMQGIYKHYKGKLYSVLFESTHSETLESMVVYQALYGEYGCWVRPKAMFVETLEDGTARFCYLAKNLNPELIATYQIDSSKVKQ